MNKSELNKSELNVEIISNVPKPDTITPFITENISKLKSIFFISVITALIMTFFFSGEKYGYIGLFIFTIIECIILFFALKNLKLIENPKAFYLYIPLNLIALSNALFTTTFVFFNTIAVHLLFGFFLLKVTNKNFTNFFDLDLYVSILRNFLPNINFGIAYISEVFTKSNKTETTSKVKYVILGLLTSIPFAFLIIILLTTADKNFDKLFGNFFTADYSYYVYYAFHFILCTSILFLYGTKIFYTKDILPKTYKKFGFNPIFGGTFLTVLNFLYVVFLYLQLKYIITDGFMVLPDGFDYYEYAHYGFYPTLFVTIINLGITLAMTEFTNISFKDTFFKANFCIIFISNILLIFNAFNRLYIYILEYGYTTDRLVATFVLIFELYLMITLTLKLTRNVNFYKLVFIGFIATYTTQALVCNDYVSTALNFNKFNITADTKFISTYGENELYYHDYVEVKNSDNGFSFKLNDDSMAYVIKNTNNPQIENLFENNYRDYRFYTKTILQLRTEKQLTDK